MLKSLKNTYNSFPRQFWLIAFGVIISQTGSSLVWPFQLIYASKVLNQPLTTVATLITISSSIGLTVSLLGGSIADRFGRKVIMLAAQIAYGVAYLLLSRAKTYLGFLVPMSIIGAAMPFYAVGSDAMMADIIPPTDRVRAYSILRMFNNLGIAIGPAIGGFIVSKSYTVAFYGAATGMTIYGLILLFFVRETLTKKESVQKESLLSNLKDYRLVLSDGKFIGFVLSVAFGLIAPLMLWTLLAVYTKTYFGLPEYLYSWLPITNALMCVFVQYFVTKVTRQYDSLPVITFGMLTYAIGVGSVALMSNFWGFWVSMVILTFGELILIPTGTTYAANRAPVELRGRYMTIYWLTWGIARALAPIIGGTLNDVISPRFIWIGGLIIGLTSSGILLALSRKKRLQSTVNNLDPS